MSTCDKSKQAPFSVTPTAKEAMRHEQDRLRLETEQDFIDFLRTGYDDMFELATVPDLVMERMRAQIEPHRPVSAQFDGPYIVDGCIHLTLVVANPEGTQLKPVHRATIIVYPEGGHDMRYDEVSRR